MERKRYAPAANTIWARDVYGVINQSARLEGAGYGYSPEYSFPTKYVCFALLTLYCPHLHEIFQHVLK